MPPYSQQVETASSWCLRWSRWVGFFLLALQIGLLVLRILPCIKGHHTLPRPPTSTPASPSNTNLGAALWSNCGFLEVTTFIPEFIPLNADLFYMTFSSFNESLWSCINSVKVENWNLGAGNVAAALMVNALSANSVSESDSMRMKLLALSQQYESNFICSKIYDDVMTLISERAC